LKWTGNSNDKTDAHSLGAIRVGSDQDFFATWTSACIAAMEPSGADPHITPVATDESSNGGDSSWVWMLDMSPLIRLTEGQLEAEAPRMVHELSSINLRQCVVPQLTYAQ
jgi:hypothetical protein